MRNVKYCKVITGNTGFSAGETQGLVETNVDCILQCDGENPQETHTSQCVDHSPYVTLQ